MGAFFLLCFLLRDFVPTWHLMDQVLVWLIQYDQVLSFRRKLLARSSCRKMQSRRVFRHFFILRQNR